MSFSITHTRNKFTIDYGENRFTITKFDYSIINDELKTYVSGLATPLNNPIIQRIDTFISALKTGFGETELSDFADVLILISNQTQETSLKNLVENDHHVTLSATAPTFTIYEGLTGNASSAYGEVDYIASSDADNFAQNSGAVIAFGLKQTAAGAKNLYGGHKAAATPYSGIMLQIYSSTASEGTGRGGVNPARNHSSYNITGLGYDRRGMWIWNRVASNEAKLYRNSVLKATQAFTSVALSSIKPLLLADMLDATPGLYSDEQIGLFMMTRGLSTDEMTVIKNAYVTYMRSCRKNLEFMEDEQTIKASEVDKHYGFSTIFFLGERMFCIYRDGVGHNTYDGEAMMIYSDDYGVTWSSPVSVYDGSELITPDVLAEDPSATADVRDLRVLDLENGNILLFGFVSIGHNGADIDTRVEWGSKPFCIKIPYSGTSLTIASKTIAYLVAGFSNYYSGGNLLDNGVVYATTYGGGVGLYKSTDYGDTWSYVETIFDDDLELDANESSLCMSESVMYCVGRGLLTKNSLATSSDNGITWGNYTELDKRIDGHVNLLLPDNKVLLWGRGLDDDMVFFKLDGLIADTPVCLKYCGRGDIGYGGCVKHGDYYYFAYSDGTQRTGDWNYNGIYFKKIAASLIE